MINLAARSFTELPVSSSQMVYVNYLSGSDTTGTGTVNKPVQTVVKALTLITDASSTKPYVIALQAERQIETADVNLKPYVFIVGQMQRATYMRINGGSLKPDSSHATGTSWVGLSNLYWGGSSTIDWDLQAIGGSNCVFVIQNCTITGSFTYKGRNAGGGDFLEAYTGATTGSWTLDSVYHQIQSIEFGGAVAVTNTQAIGGISGTWNNCSFDANLAITSFDTVFLNNTSWPGTSGITTTGTVTLESYRGLPPTTQRTLSGGTTVTNRDNATIVPFTPTTSGNWNSVPTNAQLGLDTLATSGVVKSQTQNLIMASPNGSSGVPSFRAMVAADVPTLNQNTTGTASNVTGTVAIANGGTGQTSKAAAFDALSPMDAAGQIIYGGTSGTGTKLAAGTSGQFLKSNGAAAPSWATPTVTFTAPTIQKFTSGSGTYTTPANVLYIRVVMVGGGGGGGGSGTAGGGTGGNGGNTTFGTSLLVANGGAGGTWQGAQTSGGTASLGTGPVGRATDGANSNQALATTTTASTGAAGASSPFGGAGGQRTNGTGANATSNSGSGGSGGGGTAGVNYGGDGGAAGGSVDAIITSPSATYSYAVGAAGTGGSAGTSGNAGGSGGAGIIIVYEYYQ